MCLGFVFLLTGRAVSRLLLSRREEAWRTAEILILRHQLAVPQRGAARCPELSRNTALRALGILRDEGLITIEQGWGAFVRSKG